MELRCGKGTFFKFDFSFVFWKILKIVYIFQATSFWMLQFGIRIATLQHAPISMQPRV